MRHISPPRDGEGPEPPRQGERGGVGYLSLGVVRLGPAKHSGVIGNRQGLTWDEVEEISGGRVGIYDAPCPMCGPDRRTAAHRRAPTLRLWRERDRATFFCKHCNKPGLVTPDGDRRPHFRLRSRPARIIADAARLAEARAKRADELSFCQFVYCSALPLAGSPAASYLTLFRDLPGEADDLRFGRFVPYSYDGDRTGPAMVAAIRALDGRLTGIQATHFLASGKRRTTFGRVDGGAVQLAKIGPERRLAVAEGVETAMSFTRLFGVPCWATLGASGLETFRPPGDLAELVIAADHDPRGIEAARRLGARVQVPSVILSLPPRPGDDWNDHLRGRSDG